MPFASEAQRRLFYAKYPNLAKEWEEKTPKGRRLPERVKKAAISQERKESLQRQAAFAAGFSIPIAGGRIGKKTTISPFSGKYFATVEDLVSHAKPGDLLMVGHGRVADFRKMIVSIGTGLPHGYHAAIIGEVNKAKKTVIIYDLIATGYRSKEITARSLNNYSLFRPDEPATAKRVRRNMKNLVKVQEKLVAALEKSGMSKSAVKSLTDQIYNVKMNPVIGVRELFIPYVTDKSKVNARAVTKTERQIGSLLSDIDGIADDIFKKWKATGKIDMTRLKPMRQVCTNVSALIGMPVGPKTLAKWAGPNDFLRSGSLKNIGYRVSPQYRGLVVVFDKFLSALPNLLRGGSGIALGSFLAGNVAAAQWAKKRKNRYIERHGLFKTRVKRTIRVGGYTRKDGKYVASYTKVASAKAKKERDAAAISLLGALVSAGVHPAAKAVQIAYGGGKDAETRSRKEFQRAATELSDLLHQAQTERSRKWAHGMGPLEPGRGSGMYHPLSREVALGPDVAKGSAIHLHELGHSMMHSEKPATLLGKGAKGLRVLNAIAGAPLQFAPMAGIGYALLGDPDKAGERGAAIAALGSASEIAEEIAADRSAARKLYRSSGGGKEGFRVARKFLGLSLPGRLSYLGAGLGGVALPFAIGKYRKYLKMSKAEQKKLLQSNKR